MLLNQINKARFELPKATILVARLPKMVRGSHPSAYLSLPREYSI